MANVKIVPTGTWVIIATNSYSYDNMEQHIQSALDKKEAIDKFFKMVNSYLKDEKSILEENYVEKGLTLKEYIELATENGHELQYGIDEINNNKLFTIYRKKHNDCDNSYDIEEVKIILTFVPFGEQVTFIGESLLNNVEDLEQLFKNA